MIGPQILIDTGKTFTRSDGTLVARLYERLTKASRRRHANTTTGDQEYFYRQGVYDAFKSMQKELKDIL